MTNPPAQRPPLVLLIDDEPDIRDSLRFFLEDYEFDVLEAENGKQGIEVITQSKPDIVLCDLRMPEMDGLQVLAAIKQQTPPPPVIIISGTAMSEELEEALLMGAFSYMQKPIIDLTVLLTEIQKALKLPT